MGGRTDGQKDDRYMEGWTDGWELMAEMYEELSQRRSHLEAMCRPEDSSRCPQWTLLLVIGEPILALTTWLFYV